MGGFLDKHGGSAGIGEREAASGDVRLDPDNLDRDLMSAGNDDLG